MSSDRQIFRNDLTTVRAVLRRASRVNKRYATTGPFCLVRGELRELTPGYVSNALADGLAAIPVFGLHVLNIQILKRDELVCIHQLARFLMSKVTAAISRPFVGVAQCVNNLSPFGTALGKLFLLALQSGNVVFVPFHPALPFDGRSVAQHGEGCQPQVDTNHLVGWRQRLGFNNAREAGIPIAETVPANSERLALPLQRPVKFNLHVTDLGEIQTTFVQQPKTGLGIRKGIVPISTTKSRIARLIARLDTAKESAKCEIDSRARLLQTLRERAIEKIVISLPPGNHFNRIVTTHAFLPLLPCLFASFKRLVVDPPTSIERFLQRSSLRSSGEKTVLKRDSHGTTVPHLYNYANGIRRLYPPLERGGFTRQSIKSPDPSLTWAAGWH